jgi:hypothetical protein
LYDCVDIDADADAGCNACNEAEVDARKDSLGEVDNAVVVMLLNDAEYDGLRPDTNEEDGVGLLLLEMLLLGEAEGCIWLVVESSMRKGLMSSKTDDELLDAVDADILVGCE